MNLFVDHRGKIDIWALTPEERKLIGKNTDIRVFLKGMAKKVEKLLVIDRSPESNLVSLLLGKEAEGDSINSYEVYTAEEGYHIIWLPWGFEVATAGYDTIITLNPPYSEAREADENA